MTQIVYPIFSDKFKQESSEQENKYIISAIQNGHKHPFYMVSLPPTEENPLRYNWSNDISEASIYSKEEAHKRYITAIVITALEPIKHDYDYTVEVI